MNVKAKFRCSGKMQLEHYNEVQLEPVTYGEFGAATPSGDLRLGGVTQEVFDGFELGREYNILITPNQEVNTDG